MLQYSTLGTAMTLYGLSSMRRVLIIGWTTVNSASFLMIVVDHVINEYIYYEIQIKYSTNIPLHEL